MKENQAYCIKKILRYFLIFRQFYGIMNAEAFIIIYLKALADTQIKDLLPAIGRLYHNATLIWYNIFIIKRMEDRSMSERNTVNNDTTLAQENAALRNKVAVLEEQLSLMREQFEWLKKQVFGRKTEQTSVIMGNDTQLSFFPVTDDKNRKVADIALILMQEAALKDMYQIYLQEIDQIAI